MRTMKRAGIFMALVLALANASTEGTTHEESSGSVDENQILEYLDVNLDPVLVGEDEGAGDSAIDNDDDTKTSSTSAVAQKSRRHYLRRHVQACDVTCFNNFSCNSNIQRYPVCSQFTICSNGYCQRPNNNNNNNNNNRNQLQRCGLFCGDNLNFCSNAIDGCNQCNGSTCVYGANICGRSCNSFNNPCPAGSACNSCVNGFCRQGQSRCGVQCNFNAAICNGATDGCNVCNGYSCARGYNPTPQCNTACSFDSNCNGAPNGCTVCTNGRCTVGNRNGGGGGGCVRDQNGLNSRLQAGGTITVCANARIILTNELVTSRSNIRLQCAGGSCTIVGNSQFRLLRFIASNITIIGIDFQRGYADSRNSDGKGGAIYISGGGNVIRNCSFTSNRAGRQGGAASMQSGTLSGIRFSSNYAPECYNIYVTGRCYNG